MGHSRASATRIKAAERRAQALALRRGGASYAQIGRLMGVSESRAYRLIMGELERINRDRQESAEAVIQLELQRLDSLFTVAYQAAMSGDLGAVGTCLNIMARRSRLLGLDQIAHTTPDQAAQPSANVGISIGDLLAKWREEERLAAEQVPPQETALLECKQTPAVVGRSGIVIGPPPLAAVDQRLPPAPLPAPPGVVNGADNGRPADDSKDGVLDNPRWRRYTASASDYLERFHP